MNKKNIPDICTSLSCDSLGCDYCKKCSHAIYKGGTLAAGRFWFWEFNPRFGPRFNFDLPENHPGWESFSKWLKENKL